MTPLSVAIVGCGRIAFAFERDPKRKKPASHFGAISSMSDHFTLTSVCDNDPAKLDSIPDLQPSPACFSCHRTLLKQARPDLMVISSPTPLHCQMATDALHAGVKGIILEKPVSPSLKESYRLLNLQRKYGTPILVFHERRYDPLFTWTAEQISQNSYGPLHSVNAKLCSASYPTGPIAHPFERFGGGPLVHDGTHMTDLFNFLFAPIHTVSATLKHQVPIAATETSLHGLLYARDRIPIYFDLDGTSSYFHFELDLFFQNARLRVGNGIRELSTPLSAQQYSGYQSLQPQPFPGIPSHSPFVTAYQEIYNAITTGSAINSNLTQGVKALELIYALYRSTKGRGRPVSLPLRSHSHPYRRQTFFSSS